MVSNGEHVVHRCSVEYYSDQDAEIAINACIDKTCGLLDSNIQYHSRYLLFGWDTTSSTLTIVVTDDEKQRDSRDVVQCQFVATDKPLDPEDIQFWIKDYLTTCAAFLRYSLIAAFHRESRANCTLL
ncbi:hypothetical protein [Microbulbifer elongatus]|uniref:hypothetical protein n=1 Tax=Microbulbifer elongatus TaxID=86173 RepID=UPI001CFE66F1|nr:hypothetical protein [Microbulbifer elongatus]